MIPKHNTYILDINSKFMEDRSNNRKYLDLQFLQEELDEDPANTRTYYYFATTYSSLKQYDKAYEWFLKRINHENQGFLQEKVDACFEAARLANFQLNKPWEECKKLYEKAYELDNERPDSLYFIGIHYYLKNDFITSHEYFKKVHEIGYPIHRQFSLKPNLSFHFCPKFLCTTSWHNKDYKLGEEISTFYLTNGYNKQNEDMEYSSIMSWHLLYRKLNTLPPKVEIKDISNINNLNKPLFCFVADGAFKKLSGSSINKKGVGSSETYIIEMARYIQKSGQYNVIVFCNCEQVEIFEDVTYKHLDTYPEFITKNIIQHCIISRYTEYIPMTYESYVENVYLVLHDLAPVGAVIPRHDKLKKIFCLTEWHVENFTKYFGLLKDITVPFYYGVDTDKFKIDHSVKKIPFKFIYSSFPDRGLLELLKMWPKIYELETRSTLHIYSNVDHKWSNDVEPEKIQKMQKIRDLLNNYKLHSNKLGIHYHSWVSKKELAESWKTAEFWLYPCTFQETFCSTALEAAITKTFVISNNLAALKNTVGDRGLIIDGDPETEEWKETSLHKIKEIFANREFLNNKIQENYDWAKNLTWENQANKLLNDFINSNNLIYLNQYNWKNNKNHFDTIENILTKIKLENNCSKILEISTDTGTSIVQFNKILNNSKCYYINCNYENNKNIIVNNFSVSNFKDEIILLNEKFNSLDEKEILFEINKQNFKTDFIHINSYGLELNLCTILFLAWKLLNKNGILLITKCFSDLYLNIINHFFNKVDITLISDKECIVIKKN
jgi:tetratricopeptide (TPR) repeat protein